MLSLNTNCDIIQIYLSQSSRKSEDNNSNHRLSPKHHRRLSCVPFYRILSVPASEFNSSLLSLYRLSETLFTKSVSPFISAYGINPGSWGLSRSSKLLVWCGLLIEVWTILGIYLHTWSGTVLSLCQLLSKRPLSFISLTVLQNESADTSTVSCLPIAFARGMMKRFSVFDFVFFEWSKVHQTTELNVLAGQITIRAIGRSTDRVHRVTPLPVSKKL